MVLSLLLDDMDRGFVDLGALFGKAESGKSDLLFGTRFWLTGTGESPFCDVDMEDTCGKVDETVSN